MPNDAPDAVLRRLAEQLLNGSLDGAAFRQAVDSVGCEYLPGATLDVDREARCGYPEAVFGAGKPIPVLLDIVAALRQRQQAILVTRVDADQARAVLAVHPDLVYQSEAGTLRSPCDTQSAVHGAGLVAIVTAGTCDVQVAEEARETLRWMGIEPTMFIDVGVAGPHRLRSHVAELRKARAIVVVAGMEGALPSVVAGHVGCPVIAVPTSVGYGASLGGLAALLSMLNSCAANVAVCNIDAGFKGGYLAGLIAKQPPNEALGG